jgi:hypothetical protein
MNLLETILRRAYASSHGIAVTTTEVDTLRRQLYVERKRIREEGDETLDCIQISPAPNTNTELWLWKKDDGT